MAPTSAEAGLSRDSPHTHTKSSTRSIAGSTCSPAAVSPATSIADPESDPLSTVRQRRAHLPPPQASPPAPPSP
eukprot:CAMPEP_0180144384 /NCGR_PEP_ID=MMETSP0986-20121125/16896_1 /TAXON_ID=697907 /ORGANISM="non described non described, Strain CCMP2293" /LENGTH=73 /DNA_ID=CAMNT_0022088267 /DNA_START=65 /DNA_END=283 /DNA_ORIENTATION=-